MGLFALRRDSHPTCVCFRVHNLREILDVGQALSAWVLHPALRTGSRAWMGAPCRVSVVCIPGSPYLRLCVLYRTLSGLQGHGGVVLGFLSSEANRSGTNSCSPSRTSLLFFLMDRSGTRGATGNCKFSVNDDMRQTSKEYCTAVCVSTVITTFISGYSSCTSGYTRTCPPVFECLSVEVE